LEERGAYSTLLDYLYDRRAPLPGNIRMIAGFLDVSVRKAEVVLNALFQKGKLYRREDGSISNRRFDKEIENELSQADHMAEIGSGGGRLLGCAGQVFRRAVGVDIVYEREHLAEMTRSLHRSWGVEDRCQLALPRDLGSMPPASFGFVYSFIVFQHFDSEQVVFDYLRHIRRLVRPGGIVRLFIGRNTGSELWRADDVDFDPSNLQFDSTLRLPLADFEKIAEIAGMRRVGVSTGVRKQPWMDAQSSQMMIDLIPA
jgi:SAM-dependent methyltransferase